MYDRREQYSRQQYILLKHCYYECQGVPKDTCDLYAINKNNLCYVYNTLKADELKIKQGLKHITYPILEKIILDNEVKQ